MNKEQLKKGSWKTLVKIRPQVRRFEGGRGGPELPPVDIEWKFGQVTKDRLPLHRLTTHHEIALGYDHIREYTSNPDFGDHHGFLQLKVQLNIGGADAWIEPL